jgi:hypothetical protein
MWGQTAWPPSRLSWLVALASRFGRLSWPVVLASRFGLAFFFRVLTRGQWKGFLARLFKSPSEALLENRKS